MNRKIIENLYIVLPVMLTLILTACGEVNSDVTSVTNDSTTYIGQISNGHRNGLGVLMQGDSTVYSGQWRNGMRQGKGTITDTLTTVNGLWDHDTIVSGSRHVAHEGFYEGQLDSVFRPHGHGRMSSINSHYEGHWKHGERSGFGFEQSKTDFRVGEWKDNKYRGERLNYTSERIYGIDISKHQHEKMVKVTTTVRGRRGRRKTKTVMKKLVYGINWSQLRITHLGTLSKKNVSGTIDYPVSFIFIKATEGCSVRNAYYTADYNAARSHGYPVGTYHFFSPKSNGADQARYFLAHAHVRQGDLPPVLDLEPMPSQVQAMGGSVAMWRRVRNWLQIVEKATGMRPILYVSQTFVNRYLDDAPDIKHAYPVWIARYGEFKPDVKLWVWQLAPDGRVKGINGAVDINVFNGYETEFNQWLQQVKKK